MNKLKQKTDLELIWLQQDINRMDNDNKYTEEFKKMVNDEVIRRGKLLGKKSKTK